MVQVEESGTPGTGIDPILTLEKKRVRVRQPESGAPGLGSLLKTDSLLYGSVIFTVPLCH